MGALIQAENLDKTGRIFSVNPGEKLPNSLASYLMSHFGKVSITSSNSTLN